jgi:hypothetical protein
MLARRHAPRKDSDACRPSRLYIPPNPIDYDELLDMIRKTIELSLGDAPAAIGV